MNIQGYAWICMDIYGYPCIPMDINWYPLISMEIHWYPHRLMDIRGYAPHSWSSPFARTCPFEPCPFHRKMREVQLAAGGRQNAPTFPLSVPIQTMPIQTLNFSLGRFSLGAAPWRSSQIAANALIHKKDFQCGVATTAPLYAGVGSINSKRWQDLACLRGVCCAFWCHIALVSEPGSLHVEQLLVGHRASFCLYNGTRLLWF